jgi:hypothetical protein
MTNTQLTHTIEARYIFAMGNGDMFEGTLAVKMDAEPTQELFTQWWHEAGDDFIQSASNDAFDTLGVTEQDTVAFVMIQPEAENMTKIIQVCSKPQDWAEVAVVSWESIEENLKVPSYKFICDTYMENNLGTIKNKLRTHLRLVEELSDSDEEI